MIARFFTIVVLALALGACSEPPYTNVDNARLKELLTQGAPLYDIRLPEEWRQTGVVAGSRKLTFFEASGRTNPEFLPRLTAEVDKTAPVVLICRTGNRTDAAARELAKMGYTQIYNVRNGITHWISDGNPIVKI